MSYKSLLLFICSAAFLTACQTTETSTSHSGFSQPTQEPTPNTAPQDNKELILNYCQMSPQECDCFADQLSQDLTPEQWKILRAALLQQDAPPSGVSEDAIQSLGEKMTQAMQNCAR